MEHVKKSSVIVDDIDAIGYKSKNKRKLLIMCIPEDLLVVWILSYTYMDGIRPG
jgi:hypothetical protein